ncbi:MAG: DUF1801 domain-containing protein [Chloroflexi bacterium]|nr:DUF1801 domain-containing protein [Chloroflexota bacterium]MDA1271802.1 DUF1801 domain-containing protein [Chloroflexota bacterium]PKB58320.1 MAG: hypothetical protein BZY83_07860 [SAR202 cluster bacterium Casp-Chloro-G2]
MTQADAQTVGGYLQQLQDDRRETISVVRDAILENLPVGYEETFQHGMISYIIPLSTYPKTYNGSPLVFAALASQKSYMTVYLMNIYGSESEKEWFVERFKATGKKLDMGRSCVRFKNLDDLPIDLIGEAVSRTPVSAFIQLYESSRRKP